MTNLFKKAAALFGNWTGIKRTVSDDSVAMEHLSQTITEPSIESPESATDFIALETPTRDWGDALSQPAVDAEAAIASGQVSSTPFADVTPAPDQPVAAGGLADQPAPVISETPKEQTPRELKPSTKPSVTFTQLYELISNEVNKRTDNAITVYERLLAASREELNATRRSNRIAWSIGGVMTAVAAFGAIWSAGEVAATHVELGSLKQQVVAGQHASIERDQLRLDIMKVRDASAKVEIDALKARLDQALVSVSDRNRLRSDLEAVRKAKQEVEVELKIAKGSATQPVSDARPAASKVLGDRSDKVAGSERPDAWSTLLNGNDDR